MAPGDKRLSVIVPTLEAADSMEGTLRALADAAFVAEVVVADGGSTDGTRAIAERYGARIVDAPRGRGTQLAAGADAAKCAWLMFLHADTVPAPGWADAVARFAAAPGNRERAAVFRFAIDDASPAARRLELLVDWRCRVLGLPYGDQGLVIGRRFYDRIGGFRAMPLMEDVDIVRRIGRRRLEVLDVDALTSARRYRNAGYVRRPLLNLACLGFYFLGVPPRAIARLYG